jgi:hypothetical protein
MIFKRSLRRVGLVALAPVFWSCNATEAPVPAVRSGIYVLTAVDGRAPAYMIDSSAAGFTDVDSEVLIFSSGNRLFDQLTLYRNDVAHGQQDLWVQSLELQYELRGDTIEISTIGPCPANDYCFANDVGRYLPDLGVIRLTTSKFGPVRDLRFLLNKPIDLESSAATEKVFGGMAGQ